MSQTIPGRGTDNLRPKGSDHHWVSHHFLLQAERMRRAPHSGNGWVLSGGRYSNQGEKARALFKKRFFCLYLEQYTMWLEPRWRPETIWPQERQDSGRKESPGKGSEKPKQSGGLGEGTRAGGEEEDVHARCSKRKKNLGKKILAYGF